MIGGLADFTEFIITFHDELLLLFLLFYLCLLFFNLLFEFIILFPKCMDKIS